MPNGNPFYVHPGRELGPGLRGLAASFEKFGELRRVSEEKERLNVMKQQAVEVYQTGDPDKVAEFSLANPEIAQLMAGVTGRRDKRIEENLKDSLFDLYQNPTTENAQDLADARKELLRSRGATVEEINTVDESLAEFSSNPEGAKQIIGMQIAFKYPAEWKAMREAITPAVKDVRTADIKNYEYAKEQGFVGSLLDFQSQGKDPEGKTTAIKEFEYGEKNPKFAAAQKTKEDNKKTKTVKKGTFENSTKLRKEFLSQSKEYQKVRDSYTRVIGSTRDPSPAGDLSLIFNYMKMLDPGSVVRESEFATAAATGSYGQRMEASVQKVLSGERLAPDMRADFLSKASELLKGMQNQHMKREKNYRMIAEKNDLPVDEVVVDITAPPEEEETPIEDITTMSTEDLMKAATGGP